MVKPSAAAPRKRLSAPVWPAAETAIVALAWTLAAAMTVRLGFAAAGGTFATDECFHASVAAMLVRERTWPVELPQFYSGFFYYYPPLFHVLGALWLAAFGWTGLHLLPTAIYGGLLAVLGLAGRRLAPAGALAAAALIVVSHPTFLIYGARLYAEGLSALLTLAGALALVAWWRSPGRGRAVALGALTGLAILAKLTALSSLLLIAGAYLAAARSRTKRPTGQLVLALAIAAAMGAVVLVRNRVCFGSFLYPAGAPDLDRDLYALNVARFSTPPAAFYAAMPQVLGLSLGAIVLAAAGASAWRRCFGLWEGLLGFAIVSLLVAPLAPFVQARHLLPFMVLAALAGSAVLFEHLQTRPGARALVLAACLIPALVAQADFQSPRTPVDLPERLKTAFRQFKPLVKPDDLVLSLWTYDTAYYLGARATWPNPWGEHPERRPIAMFHETDARRFVSELRALGIGYVMMPLAVRPQEFNSANYPSSFVNCIDAAIRSGALAPVWSSGEMLLIHVPPR
jgi:hypothetical protein